MYTPWNDRDVDGMAPISDAQKDSLTKGPGMGTHLYPLLRILDGALGRLECPWHRVSDGFHWVLWLGMQPI